MTFMEHVNNAVDNMGHAQFLYGNYWVICSYNPRSKHFDTFLTKNLHSSAQRLVRERVKDAQFVFITPCFTFLEAKALVQRYHWSKSDLNRAELTPRIKETELPKGTIFNPQ